MHFGKFCLQIIQIMCNNQSERGMQTKHKYHCKHTINASFSKCFGKNTVIEIDEYLSLSCHLRWHSNCNKSVIHICWADITKLRHCCVTKPIFMPNWFVLHKTESLQYYSKHWSIERTHLPHPVTCTLYISVWISINVL